MKIYFWRFSKGENIDAGAMITPVANFLPTAEMESSSDQMERTLVIRRNQGGKFV